MTQKHSIYWAVVIWLNKTSNEHMRRTSKQCKLFDHHYHSISYYPLFSWICATFLLDLIWTRDDSQIRHRNGRNSHFWCSIGVLYFQISQFRDALDAYSRAIRLDPNIPEIWYNLGALYESCNNQIQDAIDAYTKAVELDPANERAKKRLQWLQQQQKRDT